MRHVLKSVKAEIIPSKKAAEEIKKVCRTIINEVNKSAEKAGIDAKLIVGGSVAKNTWLPGIHDIDFFLQFNYNKFKKKSSRLSDYAEKILKDVFEEVKRLHGSRDYFQTEFEGFDVEVVPVLDIKKPRQMRNITDVSPLHVEWVSNKTKKNKHLANEIRVAKKFFKAAKIYGAESFLQGFSGHVIEVLVIHYGSFDKLLKAAKKWEDGKVIDPENHYKNEKEVIEKLNESKLDSPLILVDPMQPERNAAAALNKKNFRRLRRKARNFMKSPSLKYFVEKRVTLEKLRKRKLKKKLIVMVARPEREKLDVAGAKIMKSFRWLLKFMEANDFKVIDPGFEWDRENEMMLWFFTNKGELSEKVKVKGPRKRDADYHVKSFKAKYGTRVKADAKRYYVELKRDYRTPEQLLSDILKEKKFSNFELLEVR